MGHGHLLNLTGDKGNFKRQRHAALSFLKIDMRHQAPLSRAPTVDVVCSRPTCKGAGDGGEEDLLAADRYSRITMLHVTDDLLHLQGHREHGHLLYHSSACKPFSNSV